MVRNTLETLKSAPIISHLLHFKISRSRNLVCNPLVSQEDIEDILVRMVNSTGESKMGELKNKLFKGLTEHDILTWEEEKMRYQRKMGRKVTDLEFLRYLMMKASRPVIKTKDGVSTGFLTGQGPIYEKGDTLLERYRSHSPSESEDSVIRKPQVRTVDEK